MKNFAALLFAVLCLCLTGAFAQSRRPNPTIDGESGKANNRPPQVAPSPTPIVIETERGDIKNGADNGEIIRVDTNLVTIPVKVSDRKNRFVAGLIKEDFKVWEDNVEQEIALFSNEQKPFTVALVLDMSYSAKFKVAEIQAAAIAFTAQLRPNDKVMIVSFDEEVHVLCEPTSDREVMRQSIRQTRISTGTSLYEAVDLVINERFRKIEGRKAIVLFTDGVDTTSRRAQNLDNLRAALELDALIYPIQYDTFADVQAMKNKPVIEPPTVPSPIPSRNKSPFPIPTGGVGQPSVQGTSPEDYRKADEYLSEMAARTGGTVYEASTTANLAQAFSDIAAELREFYSIGYYPTGEAKPGKKRKIKVKVNQTGVAVRARDGYVVGKKDTNEK